MTLESFLSSLLKRHKKEIKSIWIEGNNVTILASDNKSKIKSYSKNLLRKHKLKIKVEIKMIDNYFKRVLEGDKSLYNKISKLSILYDPNHFIDPIQEMTKSGHILGTKESLIRKFIGINAHFKEIDKLKYKVLDNIYMTIIEISQSVLVEKFNTICTQKQVPSYLKKYLVKKRKLEKKYQIYAENIIKTFKDFEHKKRPSPSGKELDLLQKQAGLFKDRISELL